VSSQTVTRIESGWPAHFICAERCAFHRASILRRDDGTDLVVSTVGAMNAFAGLPRRNPERRYEEVGCERDYETMAFRAKREECGCWVNESGREIGFASPWAMRHDDKSHDADSMHEAVVAEFVKRLESGEQFPLEPAP